MERGERNPELGENFRELSGDRILFENF